MSYCSSTSSTFRLPAALLVAHGVLVMGAAAAGLPDGLKLVAAVSAADTRRSSGIREVVSHRRYVIRNKHWDKPAEMIVRMISGNGVPKRYEIVSMENADGIPKRVFTKVLEAEVDASKDVRDEDSSITSRNYDFDFVGMEKLDGRECTVLELKPRRKSKMLLEGKVWVDSKESAIVRLEGRTAANVSFWIGKPWITQEFRDAHGMWAAHKNHSVSDVKLLGRTEMTIEFLNYKVTRDDPSSPGGKSFVTAIR